MKIIINTSTLIGSGVTQVAVSFLYECLKLKDNNEYYVFLGNQVSKSIVKDHFDKRFRFYNIEPKPLPILGKGFKSLFLMKKIEREIKPDAVFSVFGPSWWSPKAPHLQGYAYPHYVFPESPYFNIISNSKKITIELYKFIHMFFMKRNGQYFVSESEIVSYRWAKLLNISNEKVFTVSNTCNSFFREFKDDGRISYLPKKEVNEFRFISLCTMQEHKNLIILNKVIPILKEKGYNNIKFVLTIDQNSLDNQFNDNIKDSIINVGRIPPADCPYLFNECDALFLPTLLECFTANYPEAMYLNKPIITSNLSFATDICKDTAIYFDPLSPEDIVDCILKLYLDIDLRNEMIKKGKEQLKLFLTPKERAIKYLDILKKIQDEGIS
ncbi:glycosyltransferase [Flavobacterium sp.]|uniref:glycosyltransferase n=1 Tax=Flavobacterium sp. TaxID=239 RepID=UPI00261DEFE4|nr:glycosyltransferase [Flavobacterium sp.]MDD3003618.1 glycosyltransferase [Flavobacterium sp.]